MLDIEEFIWEPPSPGISPPWPPLDLYSQNWTFFPISEFVITPRPLK